MIWPNFPIQKKHDLTCILHTCHMYTSLPWGCCILHKSPLFRFVCPVSGKCTTFSTLKVNKNTHVPYNYMKPTIINTIPCVYEVLIRINPDCEVVTWKSYRSPSDIMVTHIRLVLPNIDSFRPRNHKNYFGSLRNVCLRAQWTPSNWQTCYKFLYALQFSIKSVG